jgi:hypothetical protein
VFTARYELDLYTEGITLRSFKQRDKCDGQLQKANHQRDVKGGEFDVIGTKNANKISKLLDEPRFLY